MLYEVIRTRQVPGEPLRRWFFSHEQDLLMWFDDDGKPLAFQLSYSKYRNERAIRWSADRGFTHYNVDDGEAVSGINDAPILLKGGIFPALQVVRHFIELSAEMPVAVAAFVVARLREHPDYHEGRLRSRVRAISTGIAIGLGIVALGLLVVDFLGRGRRGDP